jgi:hypothetical protein
MEELSKNMKDVINGHVKWMIFAFVFKGRSDSETNLAAQHRNLVTALTKKHGLTGMANCMIQ